MPNMAPVITASAATKAPIFVGKIAGLDGKMLVIDMTHLLSN
jgi:hypothetical protein